MKNTPAIKKLMNMEMIPQVRDGKGQAGLVLGQSPLRKHYNIWLLVLLLIIYLLPLKLEAQTALEDYIQIASNDNPGVQSTYTAFEASLQRAAQAAALPDPNLTIGYFISPAETRVGPQRARISISQMFPWFGLLRAKGDASAAIAQARCDQYIDAREKLGLKVRTAYYELWAIRKLIELEQANLEILNSYEKLAEARLRSGSGKLSDVYRAQMQEAESKTKLITLENQLPPLQRSFNRILNRDESSLIIIPDTILTAEMRLPSLPDSVSQHPRITQYFEMQKSTEFQAIAARKAALPQVGVGLDYVIVGKRSDMEVTDNGKDIIMPMLSVSLPLWRGKYMALREEALLFQKQYEEQAAAAINQLMTEQDMTLYQLRTSVQNQTLFMDEIILAEKTLELAITDYTHDREDFQEILQIQKRIIQYKLMIVKEVQNYLTLMAEWDYLTFINAE